jgi:hypothetical protein
LEQKIATALGEKKINFIVRICNQEGKTDMQGFPRKFLLTSYAILSSIHTSNTVTPPLVKILGIVVTGQLLKLTGHFRTA